MGADRHDRPRDGEHDDLGEHNTVADAYAPPARERSRTFFVAVLALVALFVAVFVVALLLR